MKATINLRLSVETIKDSATLETVIKNALHYLERTHGISIKSAALVIDREVVVVKNEQTQAHWNGEEWTY